MNNRFSLWTLSTHTFITTVFIIWVEKKNYELIVFYNFTYIHVLNQMYPASVLISIDSCMPSISLRNIFYLTVFVCVCVCISDLFNKFPEECNGIWLTNSVKWEKFCCLLSYSASSSLTVIMITGLWFNRHWGSWRSR